MSVLKKECGEKIPERFMRSALLLGREGMSRLFRASVLLFGVGGVGSFAAEALARAGIGCLSLVDADEVSESNINRQLIALGNTVGKKKTSVMKERVLAINPDAEVLEYPLFYTEENASFLIFPHMIM